MQVELQQILVPCRQCGTWGVVAAEVVRGDSFICEACGSSASHRNQSKVQAEARFDRAGKAPPIGLRT
jgi:uncharacterized Zn finger protein